MTYYIIHIMKSITGNNLTLDKHTGYKIRILKTVSLSFTIGIVFKLIEICTRLAVMGSGDCLIQTTSHYLKTGAFP